MDISRKVQKIPPSGIRAFFDLVMGMKDVISLGVGEPDFATPWNITEAAIYSLEQGYTTYTSNKGLETLRIELSKFLFNKHKREYSPDNEILITVGVSEAYDLAIRSIINPGDKVLIPEPCFVSYAPIVTLSGGRPVYIHTKLENGFKISPKDISLNCDSSTKAIVLNYPSNPTGASYTKKELEAIADTVKRHNILVISDEIYDELTYDFKHTSLISIEGMKDRTIYLNGFSKAYAMTGWRIGYAAANEKIIQAMTKIHQYSMMCVPTMSQFAALEAIKNSRASVEKMRREYKYRRDFMCAGLNKIGLSCHKPQGAFYLLPSIKSTNLSSIEFAKELLEKEKVAVVPGIAFGPGGEGLVRISYACGLNNLKEALTRIKRFLAV